MDAGGSCESDLDNLKATELRLGLPGTDDTPPKPTSTAPRGSKRASAEANEESRSTGSCTAVESGAGTATAAKAQVVGWPPIRSYRKNCFQARKKAAEGENTGIYVKVSMDGAPYLRKIDIKAYKGYRELREALECMFKCFSIGFPAGCNGLDCAITYEDKDGDWMLAGDVPWEMFISSCKRLRLMKGSEARGLGSNP